MSESKNLEIDKRIAQEGGGEAWRGAGRPWRRWRRRRNAAEKHPLLSVPYGCPSQQGTVCHSISSHGEPFLSKVARALDELMLVHARAPGGAQQPSRGAGLAGKAGDPL